MKIDFEKLLADYGLKVGDKIRFTNHPNYSDQREFRIKNINGFYLDIRGGGIETIDYLGKFEWEKVEPKKKVGDLNCDEIKECSKCPLRGIECGYSSVRAIRSQWEETLKRYPNLEPMRDYIEKELDKEVEE